MKLKRKKISKTTIIYCIICSLICGTIGVGAATLLYSKDVTYDNSSSGLSSTNLQDALDELYEQVKVGGASVSCDENGNCTVTCKKGELVTTNSGYACSIIVTCPNNTNFAPTSTGYKCTNASTQLKTNIVTSGDGLYTDTVEEGRYIYRGANVNNYIRFNNEMFRIMSVESDETIKIIKRSQFSSGSAWDVNGNRDSSTSTFCYYASNWGCSAWAATANLVGIPSEFIQYAPNGNSTTDSLTSAGTVTGDATLNTYLNTTYYNSLSSTAKTKVVKGIFNVSTPGEESDKETLETDAEQEKQYQWKGYVALVTVSELLRASTSTSCTSLQIGYMNAAPSDCKNNNWLWPTFNVGEYDWTLSPAGNSYAWAARSNGYVNTQSVLNTYNFRPVLYLSANITLSGSGTESDPYTIN